MKSSDSPAHHLHNQEPNDPRSFVYAVFYWLGIGSLLPWNFFISVHYYWMFKFRTVEEVVPVTNGQDAVEAVTTAVTMTAAVTTAAAGNETAPARAGLNDLQTQWMSLLAVASMVPNVLFLLLNALFGHRYRSQPRMLVSLSLVIVLFVVTAIFAKVDTDQWQHEFFITTMICVVLINVFGSIFQGGLVGVSGKFPPRYIGAVMSGQAVGGIVASACNVIVLAMGVSETNAACFCFAFAVVFLGTALAAYLAVTKTFFFKHYLGESQLITVVDLDKTEVVVGEKGDAEEVRELMLEEKERLQMEEKTKHVSILTVARKVSVYALSVFLVLFGTLACFPAVTVLVVPTDIESGSDWTTKYFIPVACFLLFNIGDFVGRTLAEFLRWPAPGRFGMWFMLLLSAARLVFIPLFMLCNAIPDQRSHLPVLIESDYAYMVLMLLFAASNGYICSVGMMSAPQVCKPEEQQSSTNVMLAALGFGLLTGAFLSNFFVKLI